MRKRSIIYIDGFNLYYGAVKYTPWKWLNIEKYFTLLRQNDDIITIKYFTAPITGPHKPNQDRYLSALLTLQKIQIIFGKFKNTQVRCEVKSCSYSGSKLFQKKEEKRTDVNIAIHILHDVIHLDFERIVLVSGDSDLVPALSMAKQVNRNKEIIVYVPAQNIIRGAAVELRSMADKHKTLPNALLKYAQFPNNIDDGKGGFITKPLSW